MGILAVWGVGLLTLCFLKNFYEGAHHDSMGNSGVLRAGDCQWMTAGSGIIHDEGKDHPGGVLHGFQMWINLPKAHKMDPPKYQDIKSSEIPVLTKAGMKAKVIAGEAEGFVRVILFCERFLQLFTRLLTRVQSVIKPIQPVQYIDFMFDETFRGDYTHHVPSEMDTTIVYVYHGQGVVNGRLTRSGEAVLLSSQGTDVVFSSPDSSSNEGERRARWSCLLMAGKKIKESVAWHGPFVMNTEEEIQQAFEDYRRGTLCKHKPVPML